MTPEMIAILAVGAALAGLIWQGLRSLRADFRAEQQGLRAEQQSLRAEQQQMRAELTGRMDRIEGRLTELGDRVSRIEGMLHWHFGRNEEPPAPAE